MLTHSIGVDIRMSSACFSQRHRRRLPYRFRHRRHPDQQWWQQDWEQQEWKPKPKGKGKGKDGKGKGKDGGKGKTGHLSDADFMAKRAEKQEELNTKHGQKDGKNPYFFHHGTPGGCRFTADDCKQGFH